MTSLDKVEAAAVATTPGPGGAATPPALAVTGLRVWFDTPRGMVRAVDGVDLTVAPGTTLGIVGESGSGKSVLARTVMNILPRNSTIRPGSRIEIEGRDTAALDRAEARALWGSRIAMVFQDPMTALTPVLTIGAQLTETLRRHLPLTRAEGPPPPGARKTPRGRDDPPTPPPPA
ncbi:ATP-binding cassette domain-containing protein, partial [Nocardia carnea]|uniref:ATP-binding cassette domain-containing protein n=1 Tax=Nocardia carnea TaxID=37328 RepID=UPI0024568203